ncbi:tripartite motif-containing protein 26-like [Varanus komodoensis]|uniref:tripartite motif-containing protein 26-like n=1 Tax=Varanus komodoensis TaxID=61221 RepID=UPI001CF7A79E|nr:tripartite motif-containing protein 26-like [Varanus komodoensis]
MEEPSRDGGASRSPVPPASQAERARMASSLAEDLVCPVCLAIFREPHLLGCGHNFCLSCLQGCVPKGQGAGTCPECRLPFQLRELKPNRALASLSSKARRLRLDEGPAVHFCEEHDEPLKLFCCQESAPICVICRDLPQHRGHDFLPTQNAVKYAQKKLKPYLNVLEKHLNLLVEAEDYQKDEINALEWSTEEKQRQISREFKVLHQILHEKEQKIKMIVQNMKKKNLKEMEIALTVFQEEVLSNKHIIDKIKAASETTDQVAFLKDFKNLMENVKECHPEEVEDDGTSGDDEEGPEEDGSHEEQRDMPAKEDAGNNEELLELSSSSSSGEEEEEEEEEEEDSNSGAKNRVVFLDVALEKFMTSLDFKNWKKMLEDIKPTIHPTVLGSHRR